MRICFSIQYFRHGIICLKVIIVGMPLRANQPVHVSDITAAKTFIRNVWF